MTEPFLVQRSGWWWPIEDTEAHGVILADCEPSISRLLSHVRGRDVIVQAGANCGVYPVALTDHFQSVITCEPDPKNYACLVKNLKARDSLKRVTALHAAFGETEGGCVPIEVQPRNCGAHRVSYTEKGLIPVWTIDGLELSACDCIWGDVEGAELFMLKGAENTIARFSPTICVEDKGLGEAFGIGGREVIEWLAARGYEQVDTIGRDKVFRKPVLADNFNRGTS